MTLVSEIPLNISALVGNVWSCVRVMAESESEPEPEPEPKPKPAAAPSSLVGPSHVLCFFHAPCVDGLAAAWVVEHAHFHLRYREAQAGRMCAPLQISHIPVGPRQVQPQSYNAQARCILTCARLAMQQHPIGQAATTADPAVSPWVYFVDCCPSAWLISQLLHNYPHCRVFVMDHHSSNAGIVAQYSFPASRVTVEFDERLCGCTLAWRSFSQPPHQVLGTMPELLSYVEDGDLGRWQLPESTCISEYLPFALSLLRGVSPRTFATTTTATTLTTCHTGWSLLQQAIRQRLYTLTTLITCSWERWLVEARFVARVNLQHQQDLLQNAVPCWLVLSPHATVALARQCLAANSSSSIRMPQGHQRLALRCVACNTSLFRSAIAAAMLKQHHDFGPMPFSDCIARFESLPPAVSESTHHQVVSQPPPESGTPSHDLRTPDIAACWSSEPTRAHCEVALRLPSHHTWFSAGHLAKSINPCGGGSTHAAHFHHDGWITDFLVALVPV